MGATPRIAPAVDYGHDLAAMRGMINDNTGVVWIANPNNPTGTRLGARALRGFIEDVPSDVIIVVDEAYFEYVQADDHPDASGWLAEFPNLIVTRTFSKAYGLAALRVGYGLSHPDVADLLNRVRQPFNVNSFAQAAALRRSGTRNYRALVAVNDRGMRQLSTASTGLGWVSSRRRETFSRSISVGMPARWIRRCCAWASSRDRSPTTGCLIICA